MAGVAVAQLGGTRKSPTKVPRPKCASGVTEPNSVPRPQWGPAPSPAPSPSLGIAPERGVRGELQELRRGKVDEQPDVVVLGGIAKWSMHGCVQLRKGRCPAWADEGIDGVVKEICVAGGKVCALLQQPRHRVGECGQRRQDRLRAAGRRAGGLGHCRRLAGQPGPLVVCGAAVNGVNLVAAADELA